MPILVLNGGAAIWRSRGHPTGHANVPPFCTSITPAGTGSETVGLLTFVFSTILGWSYYGEKAAEYLLGPRVIQPYRWLWVIAVMLGPVLSMPVVWTFADIANGLMAIPNLICLLVLSGVLIAETKHFLWSGNLNDDERDRK